MHQLHLFGDNPPPKEIIPFLQEAPSPPEGILLGYFVIKSNQFLPLCMACVRESDGFEQLLIEKRRERIYKNLTCHKCCKTYF